MKTLNLKSVGKRTAAIGLTALLTASLFVGCGSSSSGSSSSSSSDSSSKTTETKNLSGNVSTNGSTSMEEVIGALSESFMQKYPNVKVTYDATGSGSGIEAVSNGSTDIGLASRDLKDDEKSKGLKQTTIALDGVAIIVNKDNSLKDISIDQIAQIYTGQVTDWSAVGGDSGEIAAIGREAGSGTRDGFETVTGTADKCKYSQELTSTGAVIEAVKNSKSAIGYASFSAVENSKDVKVLTVGGVECNEKNIKDGSYKVQRDFNLITKKDTKLSDTAQAFFDYATSKDVADLITKAGAVPTAQ
jgi:phosphate transport system substrate-binding protein